MIADALGCPAAKSVISDLGVLQLTLLSDLCRAIAAGERDLGVVTGGEAIYPLSAVESKHVVVLAQQRQLHSHPGTVLCGERALALAGIATHDITAAELYSCFPSAIQSFAQDLKLENVCPLTVTGAMPFAGGPFNSFSLEGVARMVAVLRSSEPGGASERRVGMVSNLSCPHFGRPVLYSREVDAHLVSSSRGHVRVPVRASGKTCSMSTRSNFWGSSKGG